MTVDYVYVVNGLEFLLFLGSGSAHELFFRDSDLEFFEKFGALGHFLAQQSDEIQTRGPVGFAPPLGEGFLGGSSLGAEGD